MDDKNLYKIAKKRVYAKKGLKIHVIVYLLISILLYVICIGNNQNWWIYPVIGWGIGVAIHAFSVFSSLNIKNKIEKEIQDLKK